MHYVDKGTNNETNLLGDKNTCTTNKIEEKRTRSKRTKSLNKTL